MLMNREVVPLTFQLGSLLVAGEDGGIADSNIEEFLRLYDQARNTSFLDAS